ncbi:MAG: shikimate kinase [Actinobacteria bacterium]|nr:shikimate kinase [Actinomycetota bacterium]
MTGATGTPDDASHRPSHGGRSIVLVGLMGTGKSTVARRLGHLFGLEVVDTDDVVAARTGRNVRDIFASEGEQGFRDLEEGALADALATGPCVIAAAGGVVLRAANREALHAARRGGRAIVVWLRAGTPTLVARTSRGGHRPLLDGDPEAALERLAAERADLYAAVSDAVVDTDESRIADVVEAVVGAVHAALGGADS